MIARLPLAAAPAVLGGCLSSTWGLLPGDGWTGIAVDTPLHAQASLSLHDAPALREGVTLTTDDGATVPLTLSWRGDAPKRLAIQPDRPLDPDTFYTLAVRVRHLGGGHHASPPVRALPADATARFYTGSLPAVLEAGRCPDVADDPTVEGAVLWSEPLPLTSVEGTTPESVAIEVDADQPRLWWLRGLPAIDRPADARPTALRVPHTEAGHDPWVVPLPCDPTLVPSIQRQAFGAPSSW